MGLEELKWPRPEELIKIASERDLTSEELLAEKSASFFAPVRMLSIAKGSNEYPKEVYVRTGYNILRELDEFEDASRSVSIGDKTWAIGRFTFVIGEVARLNGHKKGIENIIRGDDFQSVTKRMVAGAADERARVFIEQFGRGHVLRDLYEIGKEENGKKIQEAIADCTRSMAFGMTTFLEKGPIQTEEQLENYCFQVAGRIGSGLLNKLVEYRDVDKNGLPVKLDDGLAEKLGEFLQLTNISKNIHSDYKEGREFLPNDWRTRDVSFNYMVEGKGVVAQDSRRKMLEKILNLAERNFGDSVRYLTSIPNELSGYKVFCLIPLITAQKTIENMKAPGAAERVFKGEPDAVKIPYGIKGIIDFSYNIAKFDNGNRTNEWLDKYACNPQN